MRRSRVFGLGSFITLFLLLADVLAIAPLRAQTVNWTIVGYQQVDVGGTSGRTGAGAAVFGGNMYVAFTAMNDSTNDCCSDDYVHIFSTNGFNSTAVQRITGSIMSDENPSLTATGATALNPPYLYIAVNSQWRSGTGGLVSIFRSADGVNFSQGPQPPSSSFYTDYSPSLATDPVTNDVYLGLRNYADQTLILCRLPASTDIWSCNNFPGTRQMGYSPSLAYWNGVLYIGFVELANNHSLRMFTSADQGQTIMENTDIANTDTSSSNPSIVVYNNVLYCGFRSNDNGHNFLYKYSLNGLNWSSSYGTSNTKLGGAPMMVSGAGLTYNSNLLWNWNSANDPSNWLWWETAQ